MAQLTHCPQLARPCSRGVDRVPGVTRPSLSVPGLLHRWPDASHWPAGRGNVYHLSEGWSRWWQEPPGRQACVPGRRVPARPDPARKPG